MEDTDADKNLVFVLRLYITGASPNSIKAVSNIKLFCEKHLKNKYELQVVDVYQQPAIAKEEQIVALPLLVRSFPLPVKRLIGNLSDTGKIIKGLDLIENI